MGSGGSKPGPLQKSVYTGSMQSVSGGGLLAYRGIQYHEIHAIVDNSPHGRSIGAATQVLGSCHGFKRCPK